MHANILEYIVCRQQLRQFDNKHNEQNSVNIGYSDRLL